MLNSNTTCIDWTSTDSLAVQAFSHFVPFGKSPDPSKQSRGPKDRDFRCFTQFFRYRCLRSEPDPCLSTPRELRPALHGQREPAAPRGRRPPGLGTSAPGTRLRAAGGEARRGRAASRGGQSRSGRPRAAGFVAG
ncbi:microsomal glutathione S-transferase 1 isoform X2 [Apus apus]|uniref:microsomal glutathione S-transferase 1 isoform X2 n=1 Tax=Apus apus TaxID=8895 RepID=UPI0021F8D612|nr:microsomal glutathione S-transferase 1 isoform X2 [Apus apus]